MHLCRAALVAGWSAHHRRRQVKRRGRLDADVQRTPRPDRSVGHVHAGRRDLGGTIDGPQGAIDVTGTLKEAKLAISMTVEAGGQTITIYMLGEVDGDTMKGTFNFGQGSSDWKGKRKK